MQLFNISQKPDYLGLIKSVFSTTFNHIFILFSNSKLFLDQTSLRLQVRILGELYEKETHFLSAQMTCIINWQNKDTIENINENNQR